MSPHRSSHEWGQALAQQAAVVELGQLGLRGVGVDELLDAAIDTVGGVLESPHVVLFELIGSDPTSDLRGRAARYRASRVPSELIAHLCVSGGTGSLPGFVASLGEPVVATSLLDDDRFTAQAPAFRIPAVSAMAAPIVGEGRVWGALCAYSEEPRPWTDDEVLFLRSVGATIGLAIQRSEIVRVMRDAAARLDLAVGAGGMGVWSWGVDGDHVALSPRFREIYGLTDADVVAVGRDVLRYVHPDDVGQMQQDGIDAVRNGSDQHQVFRIRRSSDGEVRWIESWGRVIVEDDDRYHLVGVTMDITDRRRLDQEREAMLLAERAARRQVEQVGQRLAILGAASEAFTQSLDPDVVAATLAEFCVPRIADACIVDLMNDRGVLEEAAAVALDQDALADMREIRRRRQETESQRIWAQDAVLDGAASVTVERISQEQLQAAALDADHLELLMRFAAAAAMAVPLRARGEVIGTLTLIGNGGRDVFDAEQRALIDEIASRASLALDNSRLYASRNRVARSLQDALLPPVLPTLPGLEVAARYQVAELDIEIGGDFYDVMEIAGGSWGIVLGDVCGRGPDAAALTGLMRHSIRAAVVHEQLPSRVLSHTNAAVLGQIDDSRFCTAVFVRIEPAIDGLGSARVTASSAGHPLPLIRRADGTVESVACAGSLLGVVDHPTLIDAQRTLAAGDALVLYTDGVTEARKGLEQFGEERLIAALSALEGGSADDIAAGVEDAVTTFRAGSEDDLAVVVLMARPATG